MFEGVFTNENVTEFIHVLKSTLRNHIESQGGLESIINDAIKPKTILEEYHIHTKKEWKNFLRLNHPDKIREDEREEYSAEDVTKIIEEGKKKGW